MNVKILKENKIQREILKIPDTISDAVLSPGSIMVNNNILIKLSNNWEVECKMLTGKDEVKIMQEAERKRKKKIPESPVTDMLNTIVVGVSGETEREVIKQAVAFMPAKDTRFLREAYQVAIPNVDMKQNFICSSCEHEEELEVPLTAEFFWPKQ